MKIFKKTLGVALMIGAVCSCAVHSTDFSRCKNAVGQRCVSVSKIDKMVTQGLITDEDVAMQSAVQAKPKIKKKPRARKPEFEVWITGNNERDEKYI